MLGTARDEVAPFLGRANEDRLLEWLLDEAATRGDMVWRPPGS
jgi:hypothetical protein